MSSAARHLDTVNTVDEVAAFAKVSPRTVMRAIAAGKLDALRAGFTTPDHGTSGLGVARGPIE